MNDHVKERKDKPQTGRDKSLQITYPTKVLYPECIKKSPISTVKNIQFRKWAKILKTI